MVGSNKRYEKNKQGMREKNVGKETFVNRLIIEGFSVEITYS